MGRGKHSGDPNSFQDTSSYTGSYSYSGFNYEDVKQKNFGIEEKEEEKENDVLERENIKKQETNDFLKGFGSNNDFENDYMDFEDEKEINFKKVFLVIAIILIIVIGGYFIYKYITKEDAPEVPPEPVQTEEHKLLEQIEGYKVLGKIVIKDLNIEQYILDSTEDKALENGVVKLYGGSLNNYGNFCIAGHNYDNVFKELSKLEKDDKFVIVDKNLKETEYEVKETYSVEPDDLKCLIQNDEKIEITLITCEDIGTKRFIVKAEEVDSAESSSNTNTTNTNNTELDAKENG